MSQWMLSGMCCVLLSVVPLSAQQRPDYASMSIEDLMKIQVTSVSKKEQPLSRSAAAIDVITEDDIRHSGSTSIPDLLRFVPGLEVAQINAHTWAISARGFNGRFSNKLLVLVDGRTVYSPLFSGVYWDAQDVPLDTIERIEVIRGPGTALWGANAVNGIINIITKKAQDTAGGSLKVRSGNSDLGTATVLFGDALGPNTNYRLYGKFSNHNHFDLADGSAGTDRWLTGRAGFRVDWKGPSSDSLTIEGDAGVVRERQESLRLQSFAEPVPKTVLDQPDIGQGNILARWNHALAGGSRMSVQAYFDRSTRQELSFGENRNTYDIDLEHVLPSGDRHDVIWGLGYRYTSDDIGARFGEAFRPASRGDQLFTAFVQDEIKLAADRVRLTLGSKLEHNDYTGSELQPNARLMLALNARNALWTAVSRAVRTPNRADHNVDFVQQPVPAGEGVSGFAEIFGNPDFRSEVLMAYEAGYRVQAAKALSVDISGFFNRYSHLQTGEPGAPYLEVFPGPPHLILPITLANKMHGVSQGLEVFANWSVTKKWRVSPGYSWFHEKLELDSDSAAAPPAAGDDPAHHFFLRSRIDLPHQIDVDSSFGYVSSLSGQGVPAYTRFDGRVGWHVSHALEVSAVVQNAFDRRHAEFSKTELAEQPTLVPRSAYAQIAWQFTQRQ